MQHRSGNIGDRLRRWWYHRQGEQCVLTTFWPQDYRCGTTYRIDGHDYLITRYLHASDVRFFEAWGRAIVQPDAPSDTPG